MTSVLELAAVVLLAVGAGLVAAGLLGGLAGAGAGLVAAAVVLGLASVAIQAAARPARRAVRAR